MIWCIIIAAYMIDNVGIRADCWYLPLGGMFSWTTSSHVLSWLSNKRFLVWIPNCFELLHDGKFCLLR